MEETISEFKKISTLKELEEMEEELKDEEKRNFLVNWNYCTFLHLLFT